MAALTEEQVCRGIGLLPADVWRAIAAAQNVRALRGRGNLWDAKMRHEVLTKGTGRSTQVLVQAIVDASAGHDVWIRSGSASWEAKMAAQARVWARKLHVDEDRIHSWSGCRAAGERVGSNVLRDHYQGAEVGDGREVCSLD